MTNPAKPIAIAHPEIANANDHDGIDFTGPIEDPWLQAQAQLCLKMIHELPEGLAEEWHEHLMWVLQMAQMDSNR